MPHRIPETLHSRPIYENKVMRLREDDLVLPSGQKLSYTYAERGPSVIIVPITTDGKMVLVRQYRYPVRDFCLEVPAGTARDVSTNDLEAIAAKELKEEVGGVWREVQKVGSFFANSSLSDEECHVFLATGVTLSHDPQREPSEMMESFLIPVAEALILARSGKMKTGPTTLAVLLAEDALSQAGFI